MKSDYTYIRVGFSSLFCSFKFEAMTKVMTPEPITEGQIGKINELLAAKLRKHKNELPSEIVQKAMGMPELAEELFQAIQKRVEALSDMIVRTVKVDRSRSAKQAIDATGRKQYLNDAVVAEMPMATGEEVEVFFFKLGRQVSNADLEKEYELRGLTPDPIAQMAVNETDPAFADEHPNGTQWKNSKDQWCFAACHRWGGDGRYVAVNQSGHAWDGHWWFAGTRKLELITK